MSEDVPKSAPLAGDTAQFVCARSGLVIRRGLYAPWREWCHLVGELSLGYPFTAPAARPATM